MTDFFKLLEGLESPSTQIVAAPKSNTSTFGPTGLVASMKRGANNAESRAMSFKEAVMKLSDSDKKLLIKMVNKVSLDKATHAAFIERISKSSESWVEGNVFKRYKEDAEAILSIVKNIPGINWSAIVIIFDDVFLSLFKQVRTHYKNSGYQWFLYNHALYSACTFNEALTDWDQRFRLTVILVKNANNQAGNPVVSGDFAFAEMGGSISEVFKKAYSGLHMVDPVYLSHNKEFKKASKTAPEKAEIWKAEIVKRMCAVIAMSDKLRSKEDSTVHTLLTKVIPRIKRLRGGTDADNLFVETYYTCLSFVKTTLREMIKKAFPGNSADPAAFHDFMALGIKTPTDVLESYYKGLFA